MSLVADGLFFLACFNVYSLIDLIPQ